MALSEYDLRKYQDAGQWGSNTDVLVNDDDTFIILLFDTGVTYRSELVKLVARFDNERCGIYEGKTERFLLDERQYKLWGPGAAGQFRAVDASSFSKRPSGFSTWVPSSPEQKKAYNDRECEKMTKLFAPKP